MTSELPIGLPLVSSTTGLQLRGERRRLVLAASFGRRPGLSAETANPEIKRKGGREARETKIKSVEA